MTKSRILNIVVVGDGKGVGVSYDPDNHVSIDYDGTEKTVTINN